MVLGLQSCVILHRWNQIYQSKGKHQAAITDVPVRGEGKYVKSVSLCKKSAMCQLLPLFFILNLNIRLWRQSLLHSGKCSFERNYLNKPNFHFWKQTNCYPCEATRAALDQKWSKTVWAITSQQVQKIWIKSTTEGQEQFGGWKHLLLSGRN